MDRTPTRNDNLQHRRGEFDTISDALDYAAKGETGFNFYSSTGVLKHSLSYNALKILAQDAGRRLRAAGLQRGDRVAVIAETGPQFLGVFFGCQYAGLIPCPLPHTIHLGGKEAYIRRLSGMLRAADASLIITPSELLTIVKSALPPSCSEILSHDEMRALPSDGVLVPFEAGDNAYIQYSSGSTSDPKGILITQRSVTANIRGVLNRMKLSANDRACSWLPFYHDMGLVGFCIAPLMGQCSVDYISTSSFARRPALWLKLMSDNKSTISYSPTFGYDLAMPRVKGEADTLDLSQWRIAGVGGDMVRPDVLERFAESLAISGFLKDAFLPSYGMAESTLAVTLGEPGQPVEVDTIDQDLYSRTKQAVPILESSLPSSLARNFVVCGRPLPYHEVVVVDETGATLPTRAIGHICVRGPSLMAGYFRNPAATAAVMRAGGFMDTGDLGYLIDDRLVITGRAKDLILHNGRNIYPQDIEWAVEQLDHVRAGDVAAFSIESEAGTDELIVLVQCRLTMQIEQDALRHQVMAVVSQAVGMSCQVVLVAPRSLPYTSSGKLSRAEAKRRYLIGKIVSMCD